MRALLFGVLALVAVASASVIKSDSVVFPDEEFEAKHVQAVIDPTDSFTHNRKYFNEPRFRGPAHIMPLSLNAEPIDFNVIQQRFHALNHNIVKRSPGWKSKGSKSKGSSSGFFSSSSKANKGNKGNQNSNGYQSQGHHQQPAYNPHYQQPHQQPAYHPQPPPAYHPPAQPAYNPYGQPGYHPAQPAYHAPQPQQPHVVVVHSGGGGGGAPAQSPGLGTALATGLASGAGQGVGFGAANAIIGGLTGSRSRSPYDSEPVRNHDNSGSSNNNNNNNNQQPNNNNNQQAMDGNFNNQANQECMKTCYSTEEYAPVCGTDGWDYQNIGKLNCMKTCGKRVEISRYGPCYVPPPPPNSPIGAPVNPPVNAPLNPAPAGSPVNTPVAPAGSPVGSPIAPVTNGGLPQVVEGPEGIITGAPIDSTSTLTPPTTTTTSPEYTACFQKCNATSEYNPQCGTDGQDYSNPQRMECAKGCGKVVEVAFPGTCVNTTVLSRQ